MKVFVIGLRGFPNIQGGVEKHCENLYPRLSKLGAEITVFARSPYFLREKRVSNWNNIKFFYIWCPRNKNFETIIYTLLASIICIFKRPDIVHIHNIGSSLFIPIFRAFRIRVILTYHSVNYLHEKWNRFARMIFRLGEFFGVKFANIVIVVSKELKDFLKSKYPKNRIIYIPNGVSVPEKNLGIDTLKKFGLVEKKYVISVGRIVPEKGFHDLINSYLMIKNPEFKLLIVGDSDYGTIYDKQVKTLAAGNKNIIFTGSIYGKQLGELYSNAKLFISCSYHEGLPIAVLEALSYEIPVLVSDIPTHREMPIQDFRFFKVGDIKELAKKMLELYYKDATENEKIKWKETLLEKYNWDKLAKKTFSVYRSILSN